MSTQEQAPLHKGLYAGSFDPPTSGHLWVIEKGAALFDELHVAVAVNPEKKSMFTAGERVEMLEEITQNLSNVSIGQFAGIYTVRYAKEIGCQFLLRGLRNFKDFDDEQNMLNTNYDLEPEVTTWLLPCLSELVRVSSSGVKGLMGPEGWEEAVSNYVPNFVLSALQKHHAAQQMASS